MLEDLKKLLELQTLDQEIKRNKERLSLYPGLLKELEQERKKRREEYEAVEQRKKDLQKKRRDMEKEIRYKEEKVNEKLLKQLEPKIKQDAYDALKHEIDALKNEINTMEDEILKAINEEEEAEKKIKGEKKKLERDEEEALEEIDRIKGQIETKQKRLDMLNGERTRQAEKVPPRLMAYYNRFYQSYGPNVVVPLEGNTCGGCHMKILPQVQVEVKKGDSVIECEGCRRILYHPES